MPTLHIPVRKRGGRQPKDLPPCKPKRSHSLPRCKNNDSSSTLTTQPTYCLHNSWSSFSTLGDDHLMCDAEKPLSPPKRNVSDDSESTASLSSTLVPSSSSSSTKSKEPKKVRIICPPDLDQVLARMQLEPLSQLRSDSCDLHGSDSFSSEHSRDASGSVYEFRAIEDYEKICRQFEREY